MLCLRLFAREFENRYPRSLSAFVGWDWDGGIYNLPTQNIFDTTDNVYTPPLFFVSSASAMASVSVSVDDVNIEKLDPLIPPACLMMVSTETEPAVPFAPLKCCTSLQPSALCWWG